MKNFFIATAIILLLSACSLFSEITLYFVSNSELPNALKIDCGEYLIPVRKTVFGSITVEKALNILFEANPLGYGENLATAKGIKDQYLILEQAEERKIGSVDTILVSFKQNKTFSSADDACDMKRMKEQIAETVRLAVMPQPFIIRLDGEVRKWECLGENSKSCQAEIMQ